MCHYIHVYACSILVAWLGLFLISSVCGYYFESVPPLSYLCWGVHTLTTSYFFMACNNIIVDVSSNERYYCEILVYQIIHNNIIYDIGDARIEIDSVVAFTMLYCIVLWTELPVWCVHTHTGKYTCNIMGNALYVTNRWSPFHLPVYSSLVQPGFWWCWLPGWCTPYYYSNMMGNVSIPLLELGLGLFWV